MNPEALRQLEGVEGFVAALVFGAVSVWLHAVNQFNRSTYEQSKEFYRLLDKLQPSDLRKGDVYRQAFLFYAVILTLVYLAVVAVLSIPGLQQFAELIPGLSALGQSVGADKLPAPEHVAGVAFDEQGGFAELGGVDASAGLSPTVPLAVSLAVVGLAPNVPALYRFEEFVRATAHRLSGIPTHLVSAAIALRDATLLSSGQGGQELQSSDWERLKAYSAMIQRSKAENKERFEADVTKVVILRRWILEQSLFAPYLPISTKYRIAEAAVRDRVATLVRDLDAASGYGSDDKDADAAAARVGAKPDLPGLMSAAEETAEDLCLLAVLYEEHHALQMAAQPNGEANAAQTERMKTAKRYVASISNLMERANIDNVASSLFSRLTVAILGVACIGAVATSSVFILPGLDPGSQAIGLGKYVLAIILSAAVTYIPVLFFTLTFQQSNYVNVPKIWENCFAAEARRSRYMPQLLACFAISLLVAFIFRLTYHFYVVTSTVGIDTVRERLWTVLDFAMPQEFVFAFQGSAAALAVVLIIDAWRAGRLPRVRWVFYAGLPVLLAAIAVLGLATQIGWSGIAARFVAGADGTRGVWRVAAENVFPAALTGLVTAVYAAGFLRDEFPRVYAKGIEE